MNPITKIKSKIEKFLRLWAWLDTSVERERELHKRVGELLKAIGDRTTVHADVRFHGGEPNQIIVIGRYQGGDYVRVFDYHGDIRDMIEMLRRQEMGAKRGRFDMVRGMKIDAFYPDDRF